MEKDLISASKFLSLVLRHKPDEIGLSLDAEGWATVDELIAKSAGRITPEVLRIVVDTNDKRRFIMSEDGKLIRANQGHSIGVDLGLSPRVPPEVLFHGTADRFVSSIMSEGIRPMQRQHVHLSLTHDLARSVGKRHGKPVILTVDSSRMAADGFQFFLSENGVWLTAAVPRVYIMSPVPEVL